MRSQAGFLTEEEEARHGADEGGVGNAVDGEVEACVPLGVQIIQRRDLEVGEERRRPEVRDEDVVASGRIHLVARSEKAAPAWIWPASTRRCRGNT